MAGIKDKVSGTAKEAAGKVTGDEKQEREGRLQQFSGDVKEKASDLADGAKDAVEGVVDKVRDVMHRDDHDHRDDPEPG